MSSQTLMGSSCYDLTTYKTVQIKDLTIGPALVTFQGRVANLVHWPWSQPGFPTSSTDTDSKPAGYFKLLVSDGTGVVVIKLYYASEPPKFLDLGSLLSLHVTHISPQDPKSTTAKSPGYFISIFPERDPGVMLSVLDESDNDFAGLCRVPQGHHPGLKYLRGLQSLSDAVVNMKRQNETTVRILVVVKRIGALKEISYKKNDTNNTARIVEVLVRDGTGEAILSLWDYCIRSARQWKVGETVLLISQPVIRMREAGCVKIILGPTTTLDIDPNVNQAIDLRSWAMSRSVEESVNLPFPTGVFDLETFHQSAIKIRFTLGDIDEFVRAKEKEPYLGYFSFIILKVNLARTHARKMLCSGECCGVPVFANNVEELCQSCDRNVQLRINPDIIEKLADETGSISGQKLVWATEAWERLLGRSASQLVQESSAEIKHIEDVLLYTRVILLIGWAADISRLVVCGVHI